MVAVLFIYTFTTCTVLSCNAPTLVDEATLNKWLGPSYKPYTVFRSFYRRFFSRLEK